MWLLATLVSVSGAQLLALACAYVVALLALALLGALGRTVIGGASGAGRKRDIAGAHVVVTGGSEGIGLAIALEAAKQGAHVTILSRTVAKLEKAAAQISGAASTSSSGGQQKVGFSSCDVTDANAVARAIEESAAARGPIDFLVCAAGAAFPGYFLEQEVGVFERTMKLNYLGTVYAAKAAAPAMVGRGEGHIILISSGAAAASFLGYSTYAPTKFAVRGFADAIRNELVGTGVRVSIAYPPDTDTPGFEHENETKPAECLRISPPEVYPADAVARLILGGAAAGEYALASPDVVQNLLISSTAGITPTSGSTVLLAALSPLLTLAGRAFGVWADHVAHGYGAGLRKAK